MSNAGREAAPDRLGGHRQHRQPPDRRHREGQANRAVAEGARGAGRLLWRVAGVLEALTAPPCAAILAWVKASLLIRNRIAYGEELFAEIVVWLVPEPAQGSGHRYKYRLVLVAHGECVIRYDNETGKGNHRHVGPDEMQTPYGFSSLEKLLNDFRVDSLTSISQGTAVSSLSVPLYQIRKQ